MSNEKKERISTLIDNIRSSWDNVGLPHRIPLKIHYANQMKKYMEELKTLSPNDYTWVKKEMDEKIQKADKNLKLALGIGLGVGVGLLGVAALWDALSNSDQ